MFVCESIELPINIICDNNNENVSHSMDHTLIFVILPPGPGPALWSQSRPVIDQSSQCGLEVCCELNQIITIVLFNQVFHFNPALRHSSSCLLSCKALSGSHWITFMLSYSLFLDLHKPTLTVTRRAGHSFD